MNKLLLTFIVGIFFFSFASAYTFNYGETITPQKVIYFNNSGTNSWNYVSNQANFTIPVGNLYRIGIGMGSIKFYNITLNITQPLTHANITWYYTRCGTVNCLYSTNITQFKPDVDTCNNFTATGVCSISFDPDNFVGWDIMRGGTASTALPPLIDSGANAGTGTYIIAYITKNATIESLTVQDAILNLDAIRIDEGEFTIETLYSNATSIGTNCIFNYGSYYNIGCDLVMGKDYNRDAITNLPSSVNFTIANNNLVEVGSPTNYRGLFNGYRNNEINIGAYNDSNNYTSQGSVLKYNNHYFLDSTWTDRHSGNFNMYESMFILRSPYTNNFAMNFGIKLINSIVTVQQRLAGGWYWVSTSYGVIRNSLYSTDNSYLLFYSDAISISNIFFNNVNRIIMGVNGAEMKDSNLAGVGFVTVQNTNPRGWLTNSEVDRSQIGNTTGTNTNLTVRYNVTIDLYDSNGDLINISTYNVSIKNAQGTTIRSGIWNGSQLVEVLKRHSINSTYSVLYDYNPITIKITAPNMIDYQLVTNITNTNRQLSFTQNYWPFEVNGTIVLSQGKTLKFIHN